MLPHRARLVVAVLVVGGVIAAAPSGAQAVLRPAPAPSAQPHRICLACAGGRPLTPLTRRVRALLRGELFMHRR